MSSDFADIHDELRIVAREVLVGVAPGQAVDQQIMADCGWLGLEIAEQFDGAGATFAEAAVVLREMGRTSTQSSYLGSAVLGVATLALLRPDQGRDGLLRAIAVGSSTVAVALADGRAGAFHLRREPSGFALTGRADFVLHADTADHLLVVAHHANGEIVVVQLPADSGGLEITPQPVLDDTRRLATVVANGVVVPHDRVLSFVGDAATNLGQLRSRAAVAMALDSLGLSEALLEATVAYVSVRQQFGRSIGSFQAVKHACANMLVEISVAGELVEIAVQAVANNSDDAATAASMAKAYTTAMAVRVAGQAMQLHGGIGYTWESGLHVGLKRATLNRTLFGSPASHRRQLAARHL